VPKAPYGRSNCWLTVILITPEEFGVDREEVRLALGGENEKGDGRLSQNVLMLILFVSHRSNSHF